MATDVIDLIFDGFADELKKGGRIEIRGFGSFVLREYKTYVGRNPKTGFQLNVAPKKLPFFKVGKELKESINSDGQKTASNPMDILEGKKEQLDALKMDILLGK
jgi:integration host factor subunit beta